jgi:hypothetical protein
MIMRKGYARSVDEINLKFAVVAGQVIDRVRENTYCDD